VTVTFEPPDDVHIMTIQEYISHEQFMASYFSDFTQGNGEWEEINIQTIVEYSKMKEQDLKEITSKWKDLVSNINRKDKNISALLNSVKKIKKKGAVLQIGYFSEILASKAEDRIFEIEKHIRNYFGLNYIIQIAVIKREK
jgi:hypothetical protein